MSDRRTRAEVLEDWRAVVDERDEARRQIEIVAQTLGARITRQREVADERFTALEEQHWSLLDQHREERSRQRAAYIRQADEHLDTIARLENANKRARIQVEALTTSLVLVTEESRTDERDEA